MLFNLWQDIFGISGSALDLLKSYLDGRTQCVQIDGIVSEYAKLVCGVPQGSVLGPLSFCAYMYPIGSILRHHGIDYHIYADDTQLYITFDLSDPTIALDKINLCISDLRTWMIKHKLKINDSKTEFMVLKRRGSPPQVGNENIHFCILLYTVLWRLYRRVLVLL